LFFGLGSIQLFDGDRSVGEDRDRLTLDLDEAAIDEIAVMMVWS